jgi:PAS domain S-box-containing protein
VSLLHPTTIRGKLIQIIFGTVLAALAVVSASIFTYSGFEGREVLSGQLSTLSRLIADRSTAALAFADERTAAENLQALQGIPHITHACLYDAEGGLFAEYVREGGRTRCAPAPDKQAEAVVFHDDTAQAQAAIRMDEQAMGSLRLVSTLDPIDQYLATQLLLGGATLVLALLLAGLLALRLQRLISGPIAAIRDVARGIEKERDYTLRTTVTGADEMGELGTAFNRMLSTIEAQNRQLTENQSQLLERVQRIRRHMDAIAELTALPAVRLGDLAAVSRFVTERFAGILGVERVGVWLFDDTETRLTCLDLYLAGQDMHQSGHVLIESDFVDEFRAIKSSKYVDAHDARRDPRTAGYAEQYLKPLGITSMLDVRIQAGSRHYGLLCIEHVGPARTWEPDEISFATEVADQLAITLQNALRNRSDEALRQSEAYNKLLFADSRIPLVVLDPASGRFIDCNAAAIDIYRLGARDNVLGKTPMDVSSPIQYDGRPSAEAAPERINTALEQGALVFEWRHQRPDGEIWDAEVHLMRFRLGEQTLMQFSLQDITARKRAEAEILRLNEELERRVLERTRQLEDTNTNLTQTLATLRRAQKELVRSEKLASLGSLVAGVAHELNTPLGNSLTVATALADATRGFVVEMNAGPLRRSVFTRFLEQTEEASELLSRNLVRASELISNFKQVAVDQASANRRMFDLKESVDEVLSTLQPQFKHTPHRTETEIPEGIELDSYPGPLGQVITNLVLNALLHGFEGQAGGRVRIEASRVESTWVRIQVSDNGRGIPDAHLEKIFDPFFTTRLGKGGSGLGLHIVYSIVTRVLGGAIDVGSQEGGGAWFRIQLPLVAPMPTREEE